ncbi:MAG: GNAT family N-acetyltransferase [Pedobacter sp.]|nr:MAG: GNAT family N-acetyltransferase [Pedobacter sp.]
MENIEVLRITVDDIIALQEISKQTFLETFSATNDEQNMNKYLEENFSADKLIKELENTCSQFYLAYLNARIIGYLKLNIGEAQKENPDKNALEIERIYVLNSFQGKKVGQLLYKKAIEVAEDLKVEYVWLGVWENNFKAIGFYERNGFAPFDEHIFRLGDEEQTDILMKRILSVAQVN